MDGAIDNMSNGFKCYSSDEANSEGSLGEFFFNFISEGRNEE